ncbi:hypothetical protein [Bordetella petrii]|uniref:hypothetical protein n=1 Tax=Bordetella petrii TaxID=94624 RepID=UPI0005A46A85|nr:hypothetical protein [Bordetella petrii]
MTAPTDKGLPADLADAIETAWPLVRSAQNDDGLPRVLIHMGGARFHAENADQNIRQLWPGLSEGQYRRAVRWLDSRVAWCLRPEAPQRRRGWVHDF